MKKRYTIVGNWKMYKTSRQAADYIESLLPMIEGIDANIYLAVPFTSISSASQYAKETPILVGAQNMNDAKEGAFTGEIAALMLKEAGAHFTLLGHSERRHIFKEDDEMIHKKVIRALSDDIQPILCIGETLDHHGKGITQEILAEQLELALEGVSKEDGAHLIIAYEPVWAIGTGKTPTVKMIQETHAFIRKCLQDLFGEKAGAKIPILYGGSVKPDNAAEIGAQKDVDGVLVGGASLDPETFLKIIQNIQGEKPKAQRKAPAKPRKRISKGKKK